jgi:hypothetical protein
LNPNIARWTLRKERGMRVSPIFANLYINSMGNVGKKDELIKFE